MTGSVVQESQSCLDPAQWQTVQMLVTATTIFIIMSSHSDLVSMLSSSSSVRPANCSLPLGMEDGRISDSQITASSSYQETLVGPEKESAWYLLKSPLTFSNGTKSPSSPCYYLLSERRILKQIFNFITIFLTFCIFFCKNVALIEITELNLWQITDQ